MSSLTDTDPDSRERMFHSGIIDFALSKHFLADELVTWMFHSGSSICLNSSLMLTFQCLRSLAMR